MSTRSSKHVPVPNERSVTAEAPAREYTQVTAARDLCGALRDFAIAAGVLLYFMGFTYVWKYYDAFGMSMMATQISPWSIITFSYSVFAAAPWWSLLWLLLLGLAFAGYLHFLGLERMTRKPHWSLRVLVHSAVLVAIPVSFVGCYSGAAAIAAQRAADVRSQAHQTRPEYLHITDIPTGPVSNDSEYARTLSIINRAGEDGRADVVGESTDRVFVFVGKTPSDKEDRDVNLVLPDDRVYSLEKSRIVLETRARQEGNRL